MKEKENYLILLLAMGIGIVAFLSYDPVLRITAKREVSGSFFPPLTPRPRMEIQLPPEESKESLFLPSYADQELRSLRDIFTTTISSPQEGEMVVTVEESGEFLETNVPEEAIQEETPSLEETPQIVLKGVVTSPQGRAVIVDVDGRIFILTSQKPLQEGVKLVKVEGKEVTLEYQGREIVFSLSD